MMSRSPLSRGSLAFVALGFLGGMLSSCRGEPVSVPLEEIQLTKISGKGGKPNAGVSDITISAVDPDTVTTDTVLTVRVLGSGFSAGSQVSWALAGSPTDAVSTIPPVLFLSSRELQATIAVSRDATLARYDVVVTAVGGKKGIGVEKLEVVAKPILLPLPSWARRSGATDVNDGGVIVGWAADGSDVFRPLRWIPVGGGWVVQELTPGAVPPGVQRSARLMTNDGYVVLGTWQLDPVSSELLWSRASVLTPGGQEVELEARSVTAMNDNGTIIGSHPQGGQAAWRRLTPTTWGNPISLPSLPGYRNGMLNHINNNDEIGGTIRRLDNSRMEWAAVWHFRNQEWAAPVLLDEEFGGCVVAMNDQGGYAGCHWPCFDTSCTSLPAFWSRAGSATELLPTYSDRTHTGHVEDINDRNLVCGSAPFRIGGGKRGAVYQHAVVWLPGLDQPRDLGALGGSSSSVAVAVNDGWPALAVGESRSSSGDERATVWIVF